MAPGLPPRHGLKTDPAGVAAIPPPAAEAPAPPPPGGQHAGLIVDKRTLAVAARLAAPAEGRCPNCGCEQVGPWMA